MLPHRRWVAAEGAGLSPAQINAYRFADNKTVELADWDPDLLPLERVDLRGMDFDLNLLGFDQDELAKLLGQDVKEGLCDPDEVPAPPDEATTQPGDLWILGDHYLLCGDSHTESCERKLIKRGLEKSNANSGILCGTFRAA